MKGSSPSSSSGSSSSGPSPELRAQVLAAVRESPAPPRAVVRRRRLRDAALAAASYGALFALFGGVRMGGRSEAYVAAMGAGLVLLAAVGGALLARRGRTMLGPPRAVLVLGIAGAFVGWALLQAVVLRTWPEAQGLEAPGASPAGCWILTLGLAAGPLGVLLALRRGSDPVHPATTGAALAVAAGLVGTVGATLHCPYAGPVHQLVGHALPIAVLAVLGATGASRWLAPRPERRAMPRRGGP